MPISVVNPQNDDDLTAQSITTNVTDRIVSWAGVHEIGGTTNGAVRHLNDQIDAKTLPETTTPTQTPANQHLYNDSTYAALSGWLGAYAGSGFIAKVIAAAGDLTYKNLVALLRSHSHADSTHGGVLVQSSTHGGAPGTGNDIDVATTSIHHTIGTGATQAAAGNHTHANMEVTTNKGAANGYAGLNGSGLLPTTVLPTAVTVTAAAWNVGFATSAGTASAVSAGAIGTTALADNAVTSAKIADGAITGADIAASTITSANLAPGTVVASTIADSTITSAKIVDGTIVGADIAATTITGGNIAADTITGAQIAANAITASELADGAVDTAAILDLNVTTGKLADQAVTNGKVADFTLSMSKFLEGAILPTSPTPNLSVTVNSLHKWNGNGSAIYFTGGAIDLTSYVPSSSSQSVYVLLQINATNILRAKAGTPTTSPLTDADRPTADLNNTPVGFVVLSTGQTQITAANIQQWIGLGGFPGAAVSGGSVVGHDHGAGSEHRIFYYGMDEGFAGPTNVPSLSILINPLHYRLASGIVAFRAQTIFGTFTAPATGFRTYGVYLDPTTGSYAQTVASDSATYPPVYPSFSGNQRSICYVHLTNLSTAINAGDNGSGGGWIEDARVWLSGSGPSSTPVGVPDGGSGQSAFAFSGLLMAGVGSTTAPFTEVAASTSATQGLAIAPPITPGANDHALVALGGATVAMGTSSMINSVAVDAVPATRSGSSGNATNAYTLRSTGPTYGTAINAAAYFKSGAAAGQAAIFDTVASPTGDIVQYKANGTAIGSRAADGRVGFGAAAQTAQGMYNGVTVTGSTSPYGFVMRPTLKPNASAVGAVAYDLGAQIDTTNGVVPAAYGMNLSALTKTGANAVTTVYGAFLQNQTIGTTNYGLVSNSANPSGFGLLNPTNTLDVTGTFGVQGPNVVAGSNYATGSGSGVSATFANADALAHLVSTATGGTGWSLGKYRFASRDNSGIGGYNVVIETNADSSSLGAWPSEKAGLLLNSRTSDASYYPSGTPAQAAYTATFSGGQLTGITQTNAGAQYQVVPVGIVYGIGGSGSGATVTFTAAGGAITGATFTPGSGYTNGTVVFNPANPGLGGISISPPTITRDMVALDARVFIGAGNTTGRAWALGPQTIIESGADGLGYVMEGYIVNNGTDQPLLNTNTSKYGLHIGAAGANPSTAAIYLDGGGVGLGQWHKGVVMAPTMLASGANDSFLELVGKFIVKPDGSVGVNQATPTAALHVVQGVVGTPAAKIVGLVGATANLLQVDASAVSNGQVLRADFSGHLYFTQLTAPGFTAGAGAGTTPGITVTGTDQSGTVAITPGSGPAASNATLITINFRNTRSSTPGAVMWTPANAAALNLARNQDTAVIAPATTAAGFAVAGGTAALIAGIPYEWQYVVL